MGNLKIKLATGKVVKLEAFHLTKTYGGLMLGHPTIEINKDIVRNISYPKSWGLRKSVYDRTNWYLSKEVLKPITYCAWLTAESIDDQEDIFDGSELIVIFIGNEPNNKTIEEVIVSGLGMFEWEKFAENFSI